MLPLANLLLLQWPIVILGGVRRFYPRHAMRVPAAADALLLAAAFLLWATSWAANGSLATRVATYGLGASVLHVYSAALTLQLQDFRRSSALKALVATQCFAAVVQLMRVAQAALDLPPWLARDELLLASGLVTVMLSIVMVYLGLLLTYERTERKLRESQRQLRFLADMDMLTEVPNRRHFYELAIKALSLSAPVEVKILRSKPHLLPMRDQLRIAEILACGPAVLRRAARLSQSSRMDVTSESTPAGSLTSIA